MRIIKKKLTAMILFGGLLGVFAALVPAQKTVASRTLTIITEPNATVLIDGVNYGKTDESGKLTLKTFAAGTHKLRIRADGFKEITQNLLPTQKGSIKIALTKTTDQAEIAFQQAETFSSSDAEKAIEMYKKAINLRPNYAEAYLGLARVLSGKGNVAEALAAIREARKIRPAYAEASAVEGRIYKTNGDEDEAIASFKRAISEGKGIQAEAHTGLGLLYRDKAEGFGAAADFESEKEYYLLAAAELKKAVAQLSGAPDAITIYQLLGDSYERAKMFKEAIAVYEEFLLVFPDSSEAVTVRSFITQLKKQMSEQ